MSKRCPFLTIAACIVNDGNSDGMCAETGCAMWSAYHAKCSLAVVNSDDY